MPVIFRLYKAKNFSIAELHYNGINLTKTQFKKIEKK